MQPPQMQSNDTEKIISLKNLSSCTAIEVFNHVSKHLLKQNKVAEELKICRYRTLNGLKCAAGSLIADDEYSPDMEGKNWSSLVTRDMVPKTHERLILELQSIHDTVCPNRWDRALNLLKLEIEKGKYDDLR